MKTSAPSLGLFSKTAFLVAACSVCTVSAQTAALATPASLPVQALADQAQKLPVTATIEKVKTDDGPPFVLKLKNESASPLEVNVTVLLSVQSHNRDKARHVPPHVIQPGKTWTVDELAALDKVTVEAKGFAPLEVEIK